MASVSHTQTLASEISFHLGLTNSETSYVTSARIGGPCGAALWTLEDLVDRNRQLSGHKARLAPQAFSSLGTILSNEANCPLNITMSVDRDSDSQKTDLSRK